jgi:hypothetical protein
MRLLPVIALFTAFAATAPRNAAADVASQMPRSMAMACKSRTVCAKLSGTIRFEDADRLSEMVSAVAKRVKEPAPDKIDILIVLDTGGGSVVGAMRIGRLLRAHGAVAFVENGNVCASACVFVLMGATQRRVSPAGQVEIHRPYTAVAESVTVEERQHAYKLNRDAIRSYLDEMNIPMELLTAMENVPPEESRVLDDRELQAYRLGRDDPVSEESRAASDAKRYGITMGEYYRRKARTETVCRSLGADLQAYAQCRMDVMSGNR